MIILTLLWRQAVESSFQSPLESSLASFLRELVCATTASLTGGGTDPSVPFLDAGLDS